MSGNKLQVSSSPHMHSEMSTQRIMLDVLIALLPAAVMSVVIFGARAAAVIGVCVGCCVLFEYIWFKIFKVENASVGDLSAAVTGVLLAFNLPSTIPLWQAAVGSLVAVIVVKQLFGGLGRNFVNPALIGRVVMSLSFTGAMTNYGVPRLLTSDVVSSATPLQTIAEGGSVGMKSLLLGFHSGVLGETCALALIAGGVYLVARGVIRPIIPLSFVATVFVGTALFGAQPLESILSGGLLLGAIFMATDYVTSPYTGRGQLIFGVGCGVLTVLIRLWANSAEGVSYAILLMNLLVPYINDLTRRKPFGGEASNG